MYLTAKGNTKSNNRAYVDRIIKFNANGSTNSSNIWISEPHLYEIETKQVRKGSKIGTLSIATKEGYTFPGWSEEENGNLITNDTIIKEDTSFLVTYS